MASDHSAGQSGAEELLKQGHQIRVHDQLVDLMSKRTKEQGSVPASDVWISERDAWGKFEPAIKRWEDVVKRTAPPATKVDGKDGTHRLSSEFSEWLMGLPEGWVTDCGLSRREELKACGNGVVPQQAEFAVRSLLDGMQHISVKSSSPVLPTPTVTNAYDDNFTSTQQKPGGSRSVTLAQMVKRLFRS